VPDLLVWNPHIMALVLLEVKDGSKTASARRLTSDQVAWHRAWDGAPVFVVTNVDEAIEATGYKAFYGPR
jgi:hypothetical protein